MKFGLRNTEVLLAALDHPQNDFPKVQIAGTNGKGSVAAFLDSICRRANIRAGLFTSPHLVSITERIRIEGVPVSEEKFAKLTTEVREAAEKLVVEKQLEALPTFFEHLTAIGLLAFARERVGLAILETGLGGRLDSVTAAKAEIVCLTPIDLDHQEFLGNTLSEIAAEKAAIIRPDVRAVVCAPQKPEAARVIRGYCRKNGVELIGSAEIIKFHRFEYLHNFTA
ncbi:MAG TPA: Mur ligase family protein, partial [Pyrinomonadaceae bacterium]|nr:Mur ligase family protein [Pyrinomonadaceae bacterium]